MKNGPQGPVLHSSFTRSATPSAGAHGGGARRVNAILCSTVFALLAGVLAERPVRAEVTGLSERPHPAQTAGAEAPPEKKAPPEPEKNRAPDSEKPPSEKPSPEKRGGEKAESEQSDKKGDEKKGKEPQKDAAGDAPRPEGDAPATTPTKGRSPEAPAPVGPATEPAPVRESQEGRSRTDGGAPQKADPKAAPASPVSPSPVSQAPVSAAPVKPAAATAPPGTPREVEEKKPPQTPAALAAPAEPQDERLVKLNRSLQEAEAREPVDPRELEALCTAFVPRKLHEQDPTLDARLKLCSARAAIADGRGAVADDRVEAARLAAESLRSHPAGRRFLAETHLLAAERSMTKAAALPKCAARLGLADLRSHEARERSVAIEIAIAHYRRALETDVDAHMTARALSGVADAAHAHWRAIVEEPATTYRGLVLPSPLFVERVDASSALAAFVGTDKPWPREIDRLYDAALRAAEHANDAALVARVRASQARHQAVRLHDAPVVAPFAIPVGAIRSDGRDFYRRSADGETRVASSDVIDELTQLATTAPLEDVRVPFAIAALAEIEHTIPETRVDALLARDDVQSRLAALRVVQKQPKATHYEPVIALFDRVRSKDADAFDRRFSTLERALWGVEEHALLALRAIVARERPLTLKSTFESRIPLDERAWLVAEVGDTRAQYRVQELVSMGDERAGAIALYGVYKTSGSRAIGFVRPYSRGLMGCVSASIQAYEQHRMLRFAPGEDSHAHAD
jgi:hypothetical protein